MFGPRRAARLLILEIALLGAQIDVLNSVAALIRWVLPRGLARLAIHVLRPPRRLLHVHLILGGVEALAASVLLITTAIGDDATAGSLTSGPGKTAAGLDTALSFFASPRVSLFASSIITLMTAYQQWRASLTTMPARASPTPSHLRGAPACSFFSFLEWPRPHPSLLPGRLHLPQYLQNHPRPLHPLPNLNPLPLNTHPRMQYLPVPSFPEMRVAWNLPAVVSAASGATDC